MKKEKHFQTFEEQKVGVLYMLSEAVTQVCTPAKIKCELTKEVRPYQEEWCNQEKKKNPILDWSKKNRLQKRGLKAQVTTDDKTESKKVGEDMRKATDGG